MAYTSASTAENQTKVFAPVPGAKVQVTGMMAGETVSASTPIRTNQGRTFVFGTSAIAGATGVAELRLPYGSGRNGSVEAGAWTIASGQSSTDVQVPPAAVLAGAGGTMARPGSR